MQKRLFVVPLLWALAWGSCAGHPAQSGNQRMVIMTQKELDVRAALVAFGLSMATALIASSIVAGCKDSK